MGTIRKQQRWKWIGHVLRKETTSVTLHWATERRRKRSGLEATRRRRVDEVIQLHHHVLRTVLATIPCSL